ncbi:MAG: WD40 repeat domain-containing protein [Planctomycetales bacterium]
MASGDYDGNVVVWRDNPAEPVASFHADGERIEAIAFSPDGQRLATVCGNNSERRAILEIRDSIQWTVQTRLQVGGSGITSIAWSPDATTLAIATMGRPSTIFFVTQNHLESVEFPETEFCSICFSPDGQYLAGGAEDGAITIWSFESQK